MDMRSHEAKVLGMEKLVFGFVSQRRLSVALQSGSGDSGWPLLRR